MKMGRFLGLIVASCLPSKPFPLLPWLSRIEC
ncbi:Uncharacterised protein [Afipia felis]|uniref:Uncharacterized protein n=1 Tax=Afipia felis ATCC 53690 TaxID=883080 RepID=A0ABP2SGI8_AFIFE|nr:hypothetical protein HMPREF9697_01322 [Afipia felis ATCC 53690]SUU77502.1 Uncharacterised protein [Afipia felis]